MDKPLAVAVFFLLCFTTQARAGPARQERPAALSVSENPASDQDKSIGSIADYVKTLNRAVTISGIGASVRDGRAKLLDGHEVSGAEVIDVGAESPAALAGLQRSSVLDSGDLIFAADGARIRNILDLADQVQGLARGDRIYLTMARRGRRVQICVTASP